jgi:hypothetical protein
MQFPRDRIAHRRGVILVAEQRLDVVPRHGTFSYFGSGQVQTVLSALQTNGAVYTYTGTYTVQNGIIVGAHIVQD